MERHKVSKEKEQYRRVEDLETTDVSVTIYSEGKGIVLKEKPLIALDAGSRKILAFGEGAEMIRKWG